MYECVIVQVSVSVRESAIAPCLQQMDDQWLHCGRSCMAEMECEAARMAQTT